MKYADRNFRTVIVSGDKDMMQLVSDNIMMIDTMKDKSYDVEAVKERFGVGPEKVIEILGLTGDQSDNIPGVPGIGPKTAQRLIEEFGSVEGVLQNIDKVRNPKTRESLRSFADQARMSHDLARIRTDADFDIDLESTRYSGPDNKALQALFKEFEFSSLLQELKSKDETIKGQYSLILTDAEFAALIERLGHVKEFAFDIVASTDVPMLADIVGISICLSPGEAFYIPLSHAYMGAPQQLTVTRCPERPDTLPFQSRHQEARPRHEECHDHPGQKRRGSAGSGVRHDGGLLHTESGEAQLRARRCSQESPRHAYYTSEGFDRQRREGCFFQRYPC